jgi:hypothetical protein
MRVRRRNERLESSAIRVSQRNINHWKESVMNLKSNKRMALMSFVLATLCASSSFAADARWKHMVGVITATDNPATETAENFNPVGKVNPATFAWSARDGHAQVDLDNGKTDFVVRGLVIIGQPFSGTAGPVQTVTGTLVCNPGDQTTEAALGHTRRPDRRQWQRALLGHDSGHPGLVWQAGLPHPHRDHREPPEPERRARILDRHRNRAFHPALTRGRLRHPKKGVGAAASTPSPASRARTAQATQRSESCDTSQTELRLR